MKIRIISPMYEKTEEMLEEYGKRLEPYHPEVIEVEDDDWKKEDKVYITLDSMEDLLKLSEEVGAIVVDPDCWTDEPTLVIYDDYLE